MALCKFNKSSKHVVLLVFLIFIDVQSLIVDPVVVVTWNYEDATKKAWDIIYNQNRSALDAVEQSCTLCEKMQCRGTVGYGGQPDENGETTLDALIMDGTTMNVGAVGGIRNIKDAISVSRRVMEKTRHSLLGGELAADFAVQMGFVKESLQTSKSAEMHRKWRENRCQPNFWENVSPDPKTSCGPYRAVSSSLLTRVGATINEDNHDTIGVVALDTRGKIAAGVSTNGQNHKIPGRIGDSAVTGAGAYADGEVGAAAATGDGDIIMRFLPSFLSVELMRQGKTPTQATETSIKRMIKYYPNFRGAVIALDINGTFGAACHGLDNFPYYVATKNTRGANFLHKNCVVPNSRN